MTSSRARLAVRREGHATRISRAAAVAPQRWTLATGPGDGWAEATHQLLGDGVFGGDAHRLSLRAGPGSRLVVRSIAATPLRAGDPSTMAVRLRAAERALVVYLPGALIPHAGADHTTALQLDVATGGAVIAAAILTPGRTGAGERAAFRRLRQRLTITVGGTLVFADESTISGDGRDTFDSVAVFGGSGALVTVVACGDHPASAPGWWSPVAALPALVGGATPLPAVGALFRALTPTLGDAQHLLTRLEDRIRCPAELRPLANNERRIDS